MIDLTVIELHPPPKTSVPPNAKVRGYMYPHLQKTVGMLFQSLAGHNSVMYGVLVVLYF